MIQQASTWAVRWVAAGIAAGVLSACGGGGAGTAASAVIADAIIPSGPQATTSALTEAQPGDLLTFFKARLAAAPVFIGATVASAASPAGGGQAWAGTQLQEQGVDEDDRIKTDGSMVYALHAAWMENGQRTPARLSAQRRQADGSLAERSSTTLNPDFSAQGLYLPVGLNRLVVLGQRQGGDGWLGAHTGGTTLLSMPFVPPSQRQMSLEVFSTADNGRPQQTSRIEIDGTLVGSRMIGSVLYVVSAWTPDVGLYQAPANSTPAQASAALAGLGTADLLPRIRVDGAAAQPLVSETDCYVQPANASPFIQLTTITAFDLSAPGMPHSSRCFAGGVEALYMSPQHVYLASSRYYWSGGDAQIAIVAPATRTDIHKFALQGTQISYRGSGDVAGHLGWDTEKKPYRMSEHNGDLRVLSFTGETGWLMATLTTADVPATPASPATLTVLRENTAQRQLAPIATLPNSQRPGALGHAGEQVYAVHFAGPQAYVVTFRRTDPLYVLDLSDPLDPKAVGELTMPGYSDYLYPLPGGKLLGVGRDATDQGGVRGLKLALFDVANPAQPRLLDSQVLGDVGSASALDFSRHGINLFTQGAQVHVALPVRVTGRAGQALTPGWQGLARYVVDTTAGTLTARPPVEATRFDGTAQDAARYARFDLWGERSVQMDTGAYYLTGGEVVYAP